MVAKMMEWKPWPPPPYAKKFEAKIVVRRLQGFDLRRKGEAGLEDFARLATEIKWKGSKGTPLASFRRSVRRNLTTEECVREDGVVEWNEEFFTLCNFSGLKEGLFQPWVVEFTVFNGSSQGPKNKVHSIGTASLNLVEFASAAGHKEAEISVPLSMNNGSLDCRLALCVSLSLLELRIAQEPSELMQRSVLPPPLSPRNGEVLTREKDEISGFKAGLQMVNIWGKLSAHSTKKPCREDEGSDERSSVWSEDAADYNYPFDTDSLNEMDHDGDSEEVKDDSVVRKSFSYGTLAYANQVGGLFYWNNSSSEDEELVYYSNSKPIVEDSNDSVLDPAIRQSPKRSIFPWRKRKLRFRSPKVRGEPLLKKDSGEGGDDIDFDRRQLSSSDESSYALQKSEEGSIATRTSVSEFGDDNFAVGSWESKEVTSRDGCVKLETQVFFASIDQRSERAAGESACTALVAVIADWFQNNPEVMPIKSQLDALIREGSLEWRNLCENDSYKQRFPDKHFDLDTVIGSKIRPLSLVPDKSFVGFFRPDGLGEEIKGEGEGKGEGGFDFLDGAMSFDSIWDEICQSGLTQSDNPKPLVYIVSWNDHFFVLKVEGDAYYLIDTLGERLYEGCNNAFILKFASGTKITELPGQDKKSSGDTKAEAGDAEYKPSEGTEIVISKLPEEREEIVVCRGKESCKEYIKRFLAAIPIRELQSDLKKGRAASTPLHHRLQIEFHFTQSLQTETQLSSVEARTDTMVT